MSKCKSSYRIFQKLLAKAGESEYDDEFLALLNKYAQIDAESERSDIFYAWYGLAHNNYDLALEYGEKAYRKRKVNLEIWKILISCYTALGRQDKAIIYQGYCSKFYQMPIEISMSKKVVKEYMEQLSLAMGVGNYAPFVIKKMTYTLNGLEEKSGVFAGKYIPFSNRQKDYSYWVGCYEEEEDLNAKACLLEHEQDKVDFVKCGGADFVFDIMKSRTVNNLDVNCENSTGLLPIAAMTESQEIKFVSKQSENSIWLGKWAYAFFRLEENLKITSAQPFIIGEPIHLQHSPKRKKFILNILVDALSWPVMKKAMYSYMPNVMKFFSKGIIFDNNFSVAEYTYPSLGAIETGMYMHHSQIFNERASHELDVEYKTLSEKMKELGYYCVNVMGSGDGIYNGSTRGYDRLMINSYGLHAYVGVERVIRQLEAFGECDQFLMMHVMDVHPWSTRAFQVPLVTQTKLSLKERLAGDKTKKASVYLPNTALYMAANQQGMRNVDRSLKVLFDYIENNYRDDEYVVQLYSDHGVPVYDKKPYILSENQVGAALMMRGAGIPKKGIVGELTSAVDIYPITAHHAGFKIPDWVDGNLPEVLGGIRRKFVVSNSIYPGQTYKLCIRTEKHEFHLESRMPVDEDGTVDLSDARYGLYIRGEILKKICDLQLEHEFLKTVDEYTASFNHCGQYWPAMHAARPEWFGDFVG